MPDIRCQMPEKRVSEGRGVLHPPLPSDTLVYCRYGRVVPVLQVGAGATRSYLQQQIVYKLYNLYNLYKPNKPINQ